MRKMIIISKDIFSPAKFVENSVNRTNLLLFCTGKNRVSRPVTEESEMAVRFYGNGKRRELEKVK